MSCLAVETELGTFTLTTIIHCMNKHEDVKFLNETSFSWSLLFRTCGEKDDCKHICTDPKLRQQGPKEVQDLTWDCMESIHVYKRQPALADNYDEYTDSHKLGLAVFRHHSCCVSKCGPNYCCCRAVAL